MVESKNMRYQSRKSKHPDVPVIKFRSSCDACTEAKVRCDKGRPHCGRCTRIGGNCRYSVSMRTGKPAIEFVKALKAGMPLALPPGFSTDRDAIKDSTDAPVTLSMADMLHQGSDQDELIDAMLQAAAAHNQSSSSSSIASTPPPPDPPHSPARLHSQEMNIDPKPSLADLSPALSSPPSVAQQCSHCTNTAKTTPVAAALHGPTPPMTNEPLEDMSLVDCFGTDTGAFDMGSVHDQPFSFSMTPTMDMDFFSHMDLPESDLQRSIGMPTPNVIETTHSGHGGGAMAIDPALQQTRAGFEDEEHSCLRVAKRLQQSTIIIASRGEASEQKGRFSSGRTTPTTTTDQALLMCSSTAKQLIDILRCRCESDAYLPFLMTVLISKVLATYSAIAKAEDSTPFGFARSPRIRQEEQYQRKQQTQTQMRQSREENPDAFVPVPLRMGAYEVEEDLEGLLRTQMVLYELSKMECVVQLFAEKYCYGSRSSNNSNSSGSSSDAENEGLVEDCNVYAALSEFIKNRYARTKAVCELRSPLSTK